VRVYFAIFSTFTLITSVLFGEYVRLGPVLLFLLLFMTVDTEFSQILSSSCRIHSRVHFVVLHNTENELYRLVTAE